MYCESVCIDGPAAAAGRDVQDGELTQDDHFQLTAIVPAITFLSHVMFFDKSDVPSIGRLSLEAVHIVSRQKPFTLSLDRSSFSKSFPHTLSRQTVHPHGLSPNRSLTPYLDRPFSCTVSSDQYSPRSRSLDNVHSTDRSPTRSLFKPFTLSLNRSSLSKPFPHTLSRQTVHAHGLSPNRSPTRSLSNRSPALKPFASSLDRS